MTLKLPLLSRNALIQRHALEHTVRHTVSEILTLVRCLNLAILYECFKKFIPQTLSRFNTCNIIIVINYMKFYLNYGKKN